MDGVSEDLAILYRAVSRRQGEVVYAGSVTAKEALRLVQLGVARLVDIRDETNPVEAELEPALLRGAIPLSLPPTSGYSIQDFGDNLRADADPTDTLLFIAGATSRSHAAATLAARAGFCCALNVLDERERYREFHEVIEAGARVPAVSS